MLEIELLGDWRVHLAGQPLRSLRSVRERWLLALLVLRNLHPLEREWLAETLWPLSEPERGRFYLRRSLSDLRGALGTEAARLKTPTPSTLHFDLEGTRVDVLEFDELVVRGDTTSLVQAIGLYRGALLPGCTEEWLLYERQVHEAAYGKALQTLAEQALQAKDFDEAVSWLRRLLRVEPLQESAVRRLMQTLAQRGDQAGMMQVYREFRVRLHAELNTQPDAQMTALYRHLRSEARQKAVPVCSPDSPSPTPLLRLPAHLTSFIGRDSERQQILFHLETARLLTLTGSGGVGKTRLAAAVAEEVAEEYRDGVCFVDLAPLQDPAGVAQAVASALELREAPGRPLLETLLSYLRERSLLLILDNCEHLCSACASLVEALLAQCRDLRLLATSREPIGTAGERAWRVPSLSLPEVMESDSPAEKGAQGLLMESEAAQLFVERAIQANTSFRLTRENLGSVSEICLLLDGIPLALEFAAAWVRVMPVEQTLSRLKIRLDLLQSRQPGRLARHQTLRETLDWSYGLLSAVEQTLIGRLSVFSGGWTLEAVEAVCAQDAEAPDGVLLRLAGLVDKSLVEYLESAGTGRYRLLETTRQYAREKLRQSGEEARLQHEHLVYFVQWAERTSEALRNCQPAAWLRLMDSDRMNLQSALAWVLSDIPSGCTEATVTACSVCSPRNEAALRLCAALWNHWDHRGYLREGRESLRRALERADATQPTRSYGAALLGAGTLAFRQGDLAEASALFADTVEVGRAIGDVPSLCSALTYLATLARVQGQMDRARSLFEELLEVARNAGYVPGEAGALAGIGLVLWSSDLVAARAAVEQCLDLYRRLGWPVQIATALMNLATTVKMQGDPERAQRLYEECISMYRMAGALGHLAGVFGNLGHLSNERGDLRAAARYHREALAIWGRNDDVGGVLYGLEALAVSLAPQGLAARAARLWGAAEALREPAGYALTREPEEYQRCVGELRAHLGESVYVAAWAEGRAMTLKQAVTYALQQDDPDGPDP